MAVIPEVPWKPPFPDPVDPWPVPIDRGSLINPGPVFDWLVNPLTCFRFDDTVIGPSGSMGATALPLHEVKGDMSKDNHLWAKIHGNLSIDLNVVGTAGFNSELGQNFNVLNRSRMGVGR